MNILPSCKMLKTLDYCNQGKINPFLLKIEYTQSSKKFESPPPVDEIRRVIAISSEHYQNLVMFSKNLKNCKSKIDKRKFIDAMESKSTYESLIIFVDSDKQVVFINDEGVFWIIEIEDMDVVYHEYMLTKNEDDVKWICADLEYWQKRYDSGFFDSNLPSCLFDEYLPLLSIYYFAEIETKIIEAESKKHPNTHNGVKNSTKVPIAVVDSTWFTNIIRTSGFGVNGHFRFQPCGKNLKERKLIWINPFEKQGYTRTAKK